MNDVPQKRPLLAVIGVSYPFRGGIAHYSTHLVRSLRKRFDVLFCTLSRQYPNFLFPGKTQLDDSANPIQEQNDPVIDSVNPWTWLRTARLLNRRRPRLIIFNWWQPFFGFAFGSIMMFLSRECRERVCFLCHNVLPHERHWLERLLCHYAFRHVRYFIVHSEEDRRRLLDLKPTAHVMRNVHPISAAFSEDEAKPVDKATARARLGLAVDRKIVLFFGLIRPYKGLAFLIEAMPEVLRKMDCTLLVAGEFYDDKSKYVAQIEKLGIGDKVRVEDQYIRNEDVVYYFRAADVVVLPYIEASQSGIIPMAYGYHTPVISTRVGGLHEVVSEGETGFLVEAGNASQIAQTILRYYEGDYEPRFRAAIANETRKFDWDEEVRHVESFVKLAEQA
jgi:glycosyltransferase involved in cell wall biosynthesis